MADFPLKTQTSAQVAIDEQSRAATSTSQWLLEGRAKIPITEGNSLTFLICGEDGFAAIAKDLKEAQSTADIICWGFDPAMELERSGTKWWRGIRYGELLDEITTRKENPVTVRLLIWSSPRGSAVQNNLPGYSDVEKSRFSPVVHHFTNAPAYNNKERHQYCVDWWAANLPGGKSNSGTNPRLRVVLREVAEKDVIELLKTEPSEEDTPDSETFSIMDEKTGLEQYATHHQKPIVIDYDWDGGSKAVGYVMGLNSQTDYWDRTAHEVDDPMRETLSNKLIGDELDREKSTQGDQNGSGEEHYMHGRPFQDYACRIEGPALAQVHYNFENGWNVALGKPRRYETPPSPPAKIRRAKEDPAHKVQILRTEAHDREKSIKENYFQATSHATNYIYIENQYFFYPEFARNLKKTRQKNREDWLRKSKKTAAEMPKLHLFIVIPHPERDEMVPRTYDTLSELGNAGAIPEQGKLVDQGKLTYRYQDSRFGPKGSTSNRPSLDELRDTLGLEVSVARLRASGPDASHNMAYREIYIHSKLMVIDDVFISVGSANINQRSMSVDSEINIAATGQLYAADLRQRIFALHSGGEVKGSGNPDELPRVFIKWNKNMSDNLSKRKSGQPMVGFLLPFEDHRSTTTRYGSISAPPSDTALA